MHRARIGARVDEFLRIDARRRRAGDIADIVGAGALLHRPRSCIASRIFDGVFRRDFADLDIGARRHMQIAAAKIFREIGASPRTANARERHWGCAAGTYMNFAPARHRRVHSSASGNCRRALAARCSLACAHKARIGVERMFFALEFFLIVEFAAGRDGAVLRLEMRGVGADRLRLRRGRGALARRRASPEARRKSFEIALLVESKIAGHRHAACLSIALAEHQIVAQQFDVRAGADKIEIPERLRSYRRRAPLR